MLRGRLMPFLKLSLSQVVFNTEFIISNKGHIMWVHHLGYRIPSLQFFLVIGKISQRNTLRKNRTNEISNFRSPILSRQCVKNKQNLKINQQESSISKLLRADMMGKREYPICLFFCKIKARFCEKQFVVEHFISDKKISVDSILCRKALQQYFDNYLKNLCRAHKREEGAKSVW